MIREFSSEYLVAVDSDGCAFDAMNGKHLNVFIPEAVAVFGLENYGDLYPQAAKTVNLFSDLRGCNRFPALYCSLMLAQKRLGQPLDIPDVEPYREFLASGSGLSRDALAQWHRTHPAAVLEKVIEWNDRVNARFKTDTSAHRVFGWVRETLEAAAAFADVMVCSAASRATLVDEWAAGGLGAFVTRIAGQENGTKSEQLQSAVRAGGFEKHAARADCPGQLAERLYRERFVTQSSRAMKSTPGTSAGMRSCRLSTKAGTANRWRRSTLSNSTATFPPARSNRPEPPGLRPIHSGQGSVPAGNLLQGNPHPGKGKHGTHEPHIPPLHGL